VGEGSATSNHHQTGVVVLKKMPFSVLFLVSFMSRNVKMMLLSAMFLVLFTTTDGEDIRGYIPKNKLGMVPHFSNKHKGIEYISRNSLGKVPAVSNKFKDAVDSHETESDLEHEHSRYLPKESLEMVIHGREKSKYEDQRKDFLQLAGTLLDKETVSGVSLRKNFYNQIIARSVRKKSHFSACCSKKGGICMTNDQPCPGQVKDLCMGKSCICCIPKCVCKEKCKPNRCCTRKGGSCITANQQCKGTLKPRLCRGSSCSCCIPA
ncbi:unnamed protein product, partial [Meganyctiphanes norvegica]